MKHRIARVVAIITSVSAFLAINANPALTRAFDSNERNPPDTNAIEIVGWPLPELLLLDLEHLSHFEMTGNWATEAQTVFRELNKLEIGNRESSAWISRCRELADQMSDYSAGFAVTNPQYADVCRYMGKVANQMKRRADIWRQVHFIAAENLAETPGTIGNVVAAQIAHRTREINFDSIDPLWSDYLMLDQAQKIFSSPKSKPAKYEAIAQKIMARATSNSLNKQQLAYAQRLIGNDLGGVLREVASGSTDLGRFLVDIERYESNYSVSSKSRLNSHFQKFYWNRNKEIQDLSKLIDEHYRNANLRIEFSQELLNLVVPSEATTIHQPVKDRILGAKVFGQSRVTNQIDVQLVPDADRLSFRLRSNGRVLSNTRAHARGFTFSNLGNAQVHASKDISIGPDGVSVEPTNVNATSQTRLTDIKGQMDIVPVFGGIARRIAQQQQQSQGLQAKQIVERKMRNEFRSRIDEGLQSQLENGKNWFATQVLAPLNAMELEPTTVQLQTTETSAIVRYRVASLDQLAADTPRPIVESGSMAIIQMHRSAANNMINRIHINGKTFSPGGFMDHLNMLMGRTDLSVSPEQDRDVTFEFAARDAIQLDFQDGTVSITLRIKKLQIGKRNRWKNLTVAASYAPTALGRNLNLKFDEQYGLQVDGLKGNGRRMNLADQLAVRTVFSALFKPDFQFSLLPPKVAQHKAASGMAISNLVLNDGWLSVSLDQASVPVNATISDQPNPAETRQSRQSQRKNVIRRQRQPASQTSRFYRLPANKNARNGTHHWR